MQNGPNNIFMSKIIEKYWWILAGVMLLVLYSYGYQNMYFHQDDLDWFLMAHKPFLQVMSAPIGDHVNYVFRLLLKLEWDLFHLYFPAYLLVSVAIHGTVVWLLYKLAKVTTGRADLAAYVALIFTINTNWTEVVLWMSGQTISITAMFVLLGMIAIWKKRWVTVALIVSSWTSALALGLLGACLFLYKKMRVKVLGVIVVVGVIYFWKGTDGTKIAYSLDWAINVGMVWGLAIVNTVIGRLFIPFDRFEIMRIGIVCLLITHGAWRFRIKLLEIWKDNWSRFLIIQISVYYLIVAVGRAQYGVGIMRAERYAYLGLAILILLVVRVLRTTKIGKWVWIVPVLVGLQIVGFYRRANDYIARPQQLKQLIDQVKSGEDRSEGNKYLPHFVLNDERLKYSDLMILLND